MLLLPILALVLLGANSQEVDVYGVSLQDKYESLERNLLTPFGLGGLVSPCGVVFDDLPSSGEQTSAEWIRVS
jgi:hypothetical protein